MFICLTLLANNQKPDFLIYATLGKFISLILLSNDSIKSLF